MHKSLICTMILWMCSATIAAAEDVVTLNADSTNEQIMLHMTQHELNQTQTEALAEHFPTMLRERAYAIQRLRLADRTRTSEQLGWKLGWTRKENPETELDPIVGHYTADRVYEEGKPLSTRYFTEGTARAEPEIVFYLKKDLPGPIVTQEELIAAIDAVGIGMEFVAWRMTSPFTREHAIIDNGIAAGAVLGADRYRLKDIDFTTVMGRVVVNNNEKSEGAATSIMGQDPVAGLLWAANELPKWGMHLRAGDFIFSGTVCPPLPVKAGDSATVSFTNLGSVSVDFVE